MKSYGYAILAATIVTGIWPGWAIAANKCQIGLLGQCPTAHGGGKQTSHNFEAKIKNPDGTYHVETRSGPGPSGTRDGRSEGGNTAGGAHK